MFYTVEDVANGIQVSKGTVTMSSLSFNLVRENTLRCNGMEVEMTRMRSRDGAVVRALASHQCGLGLIPGPAGIASDFYQGL